MDTKSVGLRKRQQIVKANQVMFLWVAGASVVIGFAIVISIFLGQKILFGQKVIAKKLETQSTLNQNIKVVSTLRDNVRVLDTNEALKSVRLSDSDRPIQSVLDALPADANDTALGSSLTSRIIGGINGVTLEAITVQPVSGASEVESVSSEGFNRINFSFSVSVNASDTDSLREVLRRVEGSIRAINITGLSVESQGTKRVMSAVGYAYYEPAKTIEMKEEVVRP